jgi:hypothetical protein
VDAAAPPSTYVIACVQLLTVLLHSCAGHEVVLVSTLQ